MIQPLHEDLLPWVQEGTVLGRMVHSPLIIQIIFSDDCRLINETYVAKRDAFDNALSDGNWTKAIMLYERPYRMHALAECFAHGLTVGDQKSYWGALGMVWVDSENIWQNLDYWRELWTPILDEPINYAMRDEQRRRLAAMPDLIPIWRGYSHKDGADGLSWSFNRERAVWFAQRFSEGSAWIASGFAPKNKVLAMFDREDEIVIFPEDVHDRKNLELND